MSQISGSRRWFLQTGMSGIAGLASLGLPTLRAIESVPTRKTSVVLFWLSGGPSHIDMWDPKPDAPVEVRGPYQSIATNVPGIRVSEHLPLHARIMDKLTLIRSVDSSASGHTPITMQAGNALARRIGKGNDGDGYPSMGSIVAKFRGPNNPNLPAFVGLADKWTSDVWGAGNMGSAFEPVKGNDLHDRLAIPEGITVDQLQDRQALNRRLDRIQRDIDVSDSMARMDGYSRQALEMVVSGKARKAFDLNDEPQKLRDAYGHDSIGEKALLARRLVEAGVTFVLVSGAWGYFDHHGDHERWGGIVKGLTPLMPRVDGVLYAMINDLQARGMLDSTLILMMGEFGRGPVMNKFGGRDHWVNCMSMVTAGGGLPCGQVIGSTDSKGYGIKDGLVRPSDLAATVFRHMGIDLNSNWQGVQGRPIPIITEGGRPIPELM